jgi:hypothetical protein
MPAVAALTIADGLASPANHTYSPQSQESGKITWEDRAPGVPAGYPAISHEIRRAGTGNLTVNQVKVGFNLPTLGSGETAQKVIRNSSGQILLNLHPESTLQERKDLLAYMANFLGIASVKTSVNDVESYW